MKRKKVMKKKIKYEYDEKGECTELNLNKYGEFTIMDDGFEDDDSEELILGDDAIDDDRL